MTPAEAAVLHLRLAERWLEGRLDRMCNELGIDPREAWRWPRIAADEAAGHLSRVSATASTGPWS
jgi:hypothetical protein